MNTRVVSVLEYDDEDDEEDEVPEDAGKIFADISD